MSSHDRHRDAGDPLVGRVLSDQYRVLRPIGEGGIGRVYLAEHLGTHRKVALKVLSPEFAGNIQFVDTFLDEARTVSGLGHENIIDIFYGGRSLEGHAFLVMEHLTGKDLADTLAAPGAMDWERARPILLQAASALSTVHAHGFLHGDIKPANLFLVDEQKRRDFVKVLDFGVAKALGVSGGYQVDERMPVLGTPQFIAPEQVIARSTVSARADIYSLGCVMYQMLTGSVAFRAETPLAVISKHAYEKPVPPRERRPDLAIPRSIEAVVLRALEKDPERRWSSMAEMSEALVRTRLAATSTPDAARETRFRMPDPAVLHRPQRRRRLVAIALAAALAAGIGVTLVVRALQGPPAGPAPPAQSSRP